MININVERTDGCFYPAAFKSILLKYDPSKRQMYKYERKVNLQAEMHQPPLSKLNWTFASAFVRDAGVLPSFVFRFRNACTCDSGQSQCTELLQPGPSFRGSSLRKSRHICHANAFITYSIYDTRVSATYFLLLSSSRFLLIFIFLFHLYCCWLLHSFLLR